MKSLHRKERYYEYQKSQKRDQKRAARLSCARRVRRIPHPAHPAAPHPAHGPAGHRQDPDHGADRGRDRCGAGVLYPDPPHAPVRARPALHRAPEVRRAGIRGHGLHHERDHRLGLPRDGAHGRQGGHPVPRRDQLHLGNAHAHDAAILAVQDLRQPAAARRLGGRGGGQPAGIQQIRARVRRGHARPRQAHRRGGGFRRLEGVRLPPRHPRRDPVLSRDPARPLLPRRSDGGRHAVRHRARLGGPVRADAGVRNPRPAGRPAGSRAVFAAAPRGERFCELFAAV